MKQDKPPQTTEQPCACGETTLRDCATRPSGYCAAEAGSRTTPDWAARAAAHATMDGDEWDAEEEAFSADWTAAWQVAFVEIAVSRGWKREDAVTWLDDTQMAAESRINAYTVGHDPRRAAEADVIACEGAV